MSRNSDVGTPQNRRAGEAKRKRRAPAKPPTPVTPVDESEGGLAPTGEEFSDSTQSLHDLFAQQTRDLIERADLDEEQKQSILIAMSCPCCGGGGMSYTVKLKR